jgi:hypothetical protein
LELRIVVSVLRVLAGVAGLVLVALGVAFWTGNALQLVGLHELIGFVLVASMWALALLALLGGRSPALAVLAVLWGVLMPVLGLAQDRLLPGAEHWIIQILHLLVGLVAIGIAQSLARAVLHSPGASTPRLESAAR